jgi:quercetin dioxygenase-like cupin family protein
MSQTSKVLKFDRYRWDSVGLREYKSGEVRFKGITRQTLLGEGDGEEPLNFLTRYFEVEPGGYSSLERHDHPHAVVILRGAGRVLLGAESHAVQPFDCVFVSPGTAHQFQAAQAEPLGFLCVVDRRRDRPVAVEPDEAAGTPATRS